MTDSDSSIELSECLRYADLAASERPFVGWGPGHQPPALLIPEGFEERSLGILQNLAHRHIRIPRILIGRYVKDDDLNQQYRGRFEFLAQQLAPDAWEVIENHDNGDWVQDALGKTQEAGVALDITGLSHRGLFGALDALSFSDREATIMYSEPAEYWPKQEKWRELSPDYANADELAEWTDEIEWLYSGRNFHVELIEGHEGYDVAGSSALVAFLPFKAGRLAAVMSHAEYSQYLFIAGRPRLPENLWRLDALKQINRVEKKGWQVVEMCTFGYRDALKQMANLLFSSDSLSNRCDIHVAPMGSKLQSMSCWVLSRITRAITMVTAIPSRYFPHRYSEGIGTSWTFPFVRPDARKN